MKHEKQSVKRWVVLQVEKWYKAEPGRGIVGEDAWDGMVGYLPVFVTKEKAMKWACGEEGLVREIGVS